MLTMDQKSVVARVGTDGVQIHQTNITGLELSWSSDGKYLAIGYPEYTDSKLTILSFPDAGAFKGVPARNADP